VRDNGDGVADGEEAGIDFGANGRNGGVETSPSLNGVTFGVVVKLVFITGGLVLLPSVDLLIVNFRTGLGVTDCSGRGFPVRGIGLSRDPLDEDFC